MKAPFVRNPYNYDTNKASDESGLECKDKSLAQQHFKDETDINFIADRYGLTGEMPQVLNLPSFGDFTGVFDFQTANNAIIAAREKFLELPAKLRKRFQNDPQQLLEFLADDDNRAEAELLGLVNKPVQELPQSRQGDATGKGDGDLPPPDSEPVAEPKPSQRSGKKDT